MVHFVKRFPKIFVLTCLDPATMRDIGFGDFQILISDNILL